MPDADLRETPLSSEPIFSGRLLKMRVDTVGLPGGGTALREVVTHPGAVAIVAVDADGWLYFVRQWRHTVGDFSLELPAGGLDKPGEAIAAAAARELHEEAGVKAATWHDMGHFHASPGFTDEVIHLFGATNLIEVGNKPEADENLEVIKMPLEEALALIPQGVIHDAKTIVGLLWYKQFGFAAQMGAKLPGNAG